MNIEEAITLLVQIPLVGIFIWYSLALWAKVTEAQSKFMEALDKRDDEYEKRNEKICIALENNTHALISLAENIETRLTHMEVDLIQKKAASKP